MSLKISSDIEFFYRVRVASDNVLARIGDWFLSPVRFFFAGIQVKKESEHLKFLPSKHQDDENNGLEALINGLFFIPGIILGTLWKILGLLIPNEDRIKSYEDLKQGISAPAETISTANKNNSDSYRVLQPIIPSSSTQYLPV